MTTYSRADATPIGWTSVTVAMSDKLFLANHPKTVEQCPMHPTIVFHALQSSTPNCSRRRKRKLPSNPVRCASRLRRRDFSSMILRPATQHSFCTNSSRVEDCPHKECYSTWTAKGRHQFQFPRLESSHEPWSFVGISYRKGATGTSTFQSFTGAFSSVREHDPVTAGRAPCSPERHRAFNGTEHSQSTIRMSGSPTRQPDCLAPFSRLIKSLAASLIS